MKNPLCRRIPKELKDDFGKIYSNIPVHGDNHGMVSGFLVAGESMKQTYDQSF